MDSTDKIFDLTISRNIFSHLCAFMLSLLICLFIAVYLAVLWYMDLFHNSSQVTIIHNTSPMQHRDQFSHKLINEQVFPHLLQKQSFFSVCMTSFLICPNFQSFPICPNHKSWLQEFRIDDIFIYILYLYLSFILFKKNSVHGIKNIFIYIYYIYIQDVFMMATLRFITSWQYSYERSSWRRNISLVSVVRGCSKIVWNKGGGTPYQNSHTLSWGTPSQKW